MHIPEAKNELPDLMKFIKKMKTYYDAGHFADWGDFSRLVRIWYTPDRLQAIDNQVMGWKKMSSYNDQQTLIHLTAALVGLLGLPEYHTLSDSDKNLALWIILYHDVAKEPQPNKRDYTHAFLSAATCGVGLMEAGYVDPVEPLLLYAWHGTTMNARRYDRGYGDYINDNSKLHDIMEGIDNLFGRRDSDAGLIICGVLFHMSLSVVDEWPQAAPLSNDEIRNYISPRLLPLLKVMMLTDNIAWSLFNPERHIPEREQLEWEFDRVAGLLGYAGV